MQLVVVRRKRAAQETSGGLLVLGTATGCGRYKIFFSQGFQHCLGTDPAADFLPAPPVKSRFVAIHSRHTVSPVFVRAMTESPVAAIYLALT